MNYTFVEKEADKAYLADRLWLPKDRLRPGPVKKALEFTVAGQKSQVLMKMWEESSRHIICPREFLPHSQYPTFEFPFVDLRPSFSRVEFEDCVTLRNEEQSRAWSQFSLNDNGILNLGCGKGKTQLGFKKIAQHGTPTLVVVPDTGILEQWQESVFGNPKTGRKPSIHFDGELGLIQGAHFDWKRPLTLALVTTLWQKIEQGRIPEEMFRYFGLIIYDECHLIGAPKFSLTAFPFYGDRIGLTATVEREDGLDPIYRYHLGEPFYSDLSQDLIPTIFFERTPVVLNEGMALVNGITNTPVLRTILGTSRDGNFYRYWSIRAALEQGRKILAISHSRAQLRLMHSMFPGSGLIMRETEARMNELRGHQLCFAIAKLGSQGVDDDRLDTLFWLTPFRSKIALQQSMGRIQRSFVGKKPPAMIFFEDRLVSSLRRLCGQLRGRLKAQHFKFENIPARTHTPTLPPEVLESYVRTEREIAAEAVAEYERERQKALRGASSEEDQP